MHPLFRKIVIIFFIFFAGILLSTTHPTRAEPLAATTTKLDQLGGPASRVVVAGGYAYLGMGPRLVRLSLADPLNPSFSARSDPLPGVVTAIAVQGQYAYVADSAKNLHIFDLSGAAIETPLNVLDLPAAATDLAADAAQLIVGEGAHGIEAYSLAAPALPAFSILRTCPAEVNGVALSSGKVFVACTTAGVGYFEDFYNLVKPGIAYVPSPPRQALDVAVSGTHVFVATGSHGITSLELQTAVDNTPMLSYATEINISKTSTRVALSGSYAYVAVQDPNYWNPSSNGSTLQIINVSNPGALSYAGYLNYRGDSVDVAVQGSAVYIAAMDGGLRTLNVASPQAPAAAGVYNPLGIAVHLQASASRVYAAADWQGLVMLSSNSAGKLGNLGQYSPAGLDTLWVEAQGSTVYLANRSPSLSIVNISNPTTPSLAGSYTTGNDAFFVAASGGTAYLGEWIGASPNHSHIQAVNVANPAAPSTGVFSSLPGSGEHSTISGNYLYVANGASGLRILSLPGLTEAGYYAGIPYANSVAVYGNTAYVLNMDTTPPYTGPSNAIYVIDVTNKGTPVFVRTIPLNGQSMRLAVDHSTLYAAACTGGLHIYDLTSPTNPQQTAVYTPPGCVVTAAADNNLVYLNTIESGLYSLWYESPQAGAIPTSGGSLSDESGVVQLVFPSGTFGSTTNITLRRPAPQEMPSIQSAQAQGLVWGGVYYTATSLGATPLKPYTVNLIYSHDQITTIVETTLAVFYWSGSVWVKETSLSLASHGTDGVDPVGNTVTFTTQHLGAFALFGETKRVFLPLVRR